jgi:hypothetical protein
MANSILEDSMKKLVGNVLEVYLKTKDEPLVGILVLVEDGELYIKADAGSKIFVVPRHNVSYYTTDSVPPQTPRVIDESLRVASAIESLPTQPIKLTGLGFRVSIGDQMICQIPVPPTFKLEVWHEDIMRVAMGDPDVRSAMLGLVQKSVEYFPPDESNWAVLKFTVDVDETALTQQPLPRKSESTFSMGGNPTTEYLSPAQMATRMNKSLKGDNKDG